MPSPMVITARHLQKRVPISEYSASRSRRPSRPSVTFSPGAPASGLRRCHGKRNAVRARLAQRLVEQDRAADVLLHPLGGEHELPEPPARLLRRLYLHLLQTLRHVALRSGPAWPGGCCARSSCALLPQAQGRAAHTRFVGRILRRTAVGGTDAIAPAIAGRAWITGVNQFVLDPDDRSPRASRSPAPGA